MSFQKFICPGLLAIFVVVCLWLVAVQARGAEATNLPPVLPPPEFMTNKAPQPDILLKDKRTNTYVTGFPAVGWDPETGFTMGAALQWYDNGPADSPFFRYSPYRERLAVAGTVSTGGAAKGLVGYDWPYVEDSPWRIRTAALVQQNKFENYFGVGEDTLGHLTYPGSPREYNNFSEYQNALNQNVNGQTWERYNEFRKTQFGGVFTVERDYWGGWLRPQVGVQINHVDVGDYTGHDFDGAIQQPTRLFLDNQAGKVIGFDGGWDNALKAGVTFDTRDFEPDPSAGVMLQAVGRVSTHALGSSFNYEQLTLSARGFHNLLDDTGRLVLAGKMSYVMNFDEVPFYSAPIIPYTDGDAYGLGGFPTLRGFVTDRFVGKDAMFASTELRWSFAEAMLGKQHLRFMIVPFVDAGRVYDSISRTTLDGMKPDGGVGFRLAWNLSTIVSFDYGRSGEGGLFYMELGHQF